MPRCSTIKTNEGLVIASGHAEAGRPAPAPAPSCQPRTRLRAGARRPAWPPRRAPSRSGGSRPPSASTSETRSVTSCDSLPEMVPGAPGRRDRLAMLVQDGHLTGRARFEPPDDRQRQPYVAPCASSISSASQSRQQAPRPATRSPRRRAAPSSWPSRYRSAVLRLGGSGSRPDLQGALSPGGVRQLAGIAEQPVREVHAATHAGLGHRQPLHDAGSGRRWARPASALDVRPPASASPLSSSASPPAEPPSVPVTASSRRLRRRRGAGPRPASSPTTVMLSTVVGEETVSPPANREAVAELRARALKIGHATVQLLQVRDPSVRTQPERHERSRRDSAHRRDVADVLGQRLPAEVVARTWSSVGSGHPRSARRWSALRGGPGVGLPERRVVADPDRAAGLGRSGSRLRRR